MATNLELPSAPAAAVDPMLPAICRVQRVRTETRDTFTLELDSPDGFAFSPGQFNMLYAFGVGEVPISISGNPGRPLRLQHTTRVVGAVTRAMRALRKGDALGVRGPFGSCWPVAEAAGRDVVVVAGGIGLAPLRPALCALLAARGHARKIVLLFGTRTPDDILFRQELERWRDRPGMEVHVTVDRAGSGWKGSVGVVPTLIPRAPFEPANAVAMVCGPELMMRFTVMELQKRGVPAKRIYVSMERNMKCATGFCGHCQYGPAFICKDGPVFRYDRIQSNFGRMEV